MKADTSARAVVSVLRDDTLLARPERNVNQRDAQFSAVLQAILNADFGGKSELLEQLKAGSGRLRFVNPFDNAELESRVTAALSVITSDFEEVVLARLTRPGRSCKPRRVKRSVTPLKTEFIQKLEDLHELVTPKLDVDQIQFLRELVSQAHATPPEDKHAFVRLVNEILVATGVTFLVDGSPARLSVTRSGLGYENIQFTVARRGSRKLGTPFTVAKITR
jgi:hypothetical protein